MVLMLIRGYTTASRYSELEHYYQMEFRVILLTSLFCEASVKGEKLAHSEPADRALIN